MKICKCCGQADIYKVKIEKTNEIVYLCAECDALWFDEELKDEEAITLRLYMRERNLNPVKEKYIVIKKL